LPRVRSQPLNDLSIARAWHNFAGPLVNSLPPRFLRASIRSMPATGKSARRRTAQGTSFSSVTRLSR